MKKKKKKKNIKSYEPDLKELDGYKLGDTVFTKLITSEKAVGAGKIWTFHTGVPEGNAFTFWDEFNSGFRSTLIELIIDDPSKRLKNKLKRARGKSNIEATEDE